MTEIVAIVPMRHASERVPGKNYRPLGGKPLYQHIVAALEAVPEIASIVIDTDSETIRNDVRQAFPDVVVLERPAHLRDGMVPMNDVLLNDVRQLPADLYLQTHSTNPFLQALTISRAINEFNESGMHDSLFGVTRLQARLWTDAASPMNHDPAVLLRTQDLEPVFVENSSLYLFSRESLERNASRIGMRPMLFEIPKLEALDIDDEDDFQLAEALVTAAGKS
jgi:CMP-N-acetylneuraminic acid synthetase